MVAETETLSTRRIAAHITPTPAERDLDALYRVVAPDFL